jgi:hypothetical protein
VSRASYLPVEQTDPAPPAVVDRLWTLFDQIDETTVIDVEGTHLQQPAGFDDDGDERSIHLHTPVAVQAEPVALDYRLCPVTTISLRKPVENCDTTGEPPDSRRLAHVGSWTPDGGLQYVGTVTNVQYVDYQSRHFPDADDLLAVTCRRTADPVHPNCR